MDPVHSTCVCRTFQDDGREELGSHHHATTLIFAASPGLGQSETVSFIDIAHRSAGKHNLIHHGIDFFVMITIKVHKTNLSGFYNVITY